MLTQRKPEAAHIFESVMVIIRRRLDALTESDFIAPVEVSSEGSTIGRLSTEQKRLWTLMMMCDQELDPLVDEANSLAQFLYQEFGSVATPARIIAAAHKREVQDAAKRLDELHKLIGPLKSQLKIVRNIFWNDVRTMLDCWGDGKLFVEPDWSLSLLTEEEQRQRQHPLSELFGGLMRRG